MLITAVGGPKRVGPIYLGAFVLCGRILCCCGSHGEAIRPDEGNGKATTRQQMLGGHVGSGSQPSVVRRLRGPQGNTEKAASRRNLLSGGGPRMSVYGLSCCGGLSGC